MSIEYRLPSSRKRSLPADNDDAELCRRSAPSVIAENGLQHKDRSFFTEALDFEQNESRKRVRTSEGNVGTWAVSPQEASSSTDEDFDSESCEAESTLSPREAALPADKTPYVSFGEGADPTYKRIMNATHKYVLALDSNKLLCQLNDLPRENEYVPRKMRDLTPTPHSSRTSDSGATVAISPSEYRRSPPDEVKIENERRLRIIMRIEKKIREGRAILVPVHRTAPADDLPSASRKFQGDRNSALFNENTTFPPDKAALPARCNANLMSTQTAWPFTQEAAAPPTHPTIRQRGEVHDYVKSDPRAKATTWEGRLREFCRECGKIESRLAHKSLHVESVAVRARRQQSREAANREPNYTVGRRKSKYDYRRKNACRQQTKSQSHFLGVYVTPSPEDSAGRSTIEERRWNSDKLEGKLLAQPANSYATPSRSPPELRVGQRRKHKGTARQRRY